MQVTSGLLCEYISDQNLNTAFHEIEVFRFAKKWIEHKGLVDTKWISEIMKHVRYNLIPEDILVSEVSCDKVMSHIDECEYMVHKALAFHNHIKAQPFKTKGHQARGTPGIYVISNAPRTHGFNTEQLENPDYIHSSHLPPDGATLSRGKLTVTMGPQPTTKAIVYDSMSCVQVNQYLFLFGAYCEDYKQFTLRYDSGMVLSL